jgi:hypothetical protein
MRRATAGDDARRPALTIVVAAASGEAGVHDTVAALAGQLDDDIEIVVEARPGALVPGLWAEGVRRARGELVGLLSGDAVPDPDWVQRTVELHRDGTAAAGGPIEPGPGLGATDWAVYFCRYAAYGLPLLATEHIEIPGDNASYRGDVLRAHAPAYAGGFWEPFVHRALREDGRSLRMATTRIVRFRAGTDAASFRRQRFAHGRHHGELRSVGLPRGRILLEATTAPLVPVLMTARAGRAVFRRRRHRLRFLAATPLLLWFYGWWAAGELTGRLRAAVRARRR